MQGAVAGASFAELDALVDNLLREGDLPSGASQAATSPPHEGNAAKPQRQQQSVKPELHPVATPQPIATPPTQTGLGAAAKTNSSADDVDALVDRILQDANVSPTLLAAPQRPPRGGAAALPSSTHNNAAPPTQSISPLPPSRFATRTTTAAAPRSTRRWPAAHNDSSKNNNNTTSRSAHEEDELPSPQPRVLSARRAAANLHHYDVNEDISFETPSHTLDSQARAQQLRRFRMWEARREARRVEAVYEALEKEQRECPFQPDTTAASLRRQILARCPQRRDGSRSKRSSSREGTSTRRQRGHRMPSDEVGTTTADARRPYLPSPLPHTSITPRTRNSSSSSSSLVLHQHPTPPEVHKAAVNKKKSDDYEYREDEDDSDSDDLLTSTRWHVPRSVQQKQRGMSASTVTTTTTTSPSARARREKRRHAERRSSHSEDAWRAMLKPSPLYAENKAWGFDAYVSRMAAARALREQRRQAEAEEIARLVDPRFIHKGPTVPEPFALSAGNAQNKTTASEEEANNTVAAAKECETRSGDVGRDIRRAARLRLYAELAPQMRAEWLFSDAMEAALRRAAQRVSEDSEGNEDEG